MVAEATVNVGACELHSEMHPTLYCICVRLYWQILEFHKHSSNFVGNWHVRPWLNVNWD